MPPHTAILQQSLLIIPRLSVQQVAAYTGTVSVIYHLQRGNVYRGDLSDSWMDRWTGPSLNGSQTGTFFLQDFGLKRKRHTHSWVVRDVSR